MSKIIDTQKKIEKGVVGGYKAIEDGVVSGYKAIENGVVSGYKKMEDKLAPTFLGIGKQFKDVEDKKNED